MKLSNIIIPLLTLPALVTSCLKDSVDTLPAPEPAPGEGYYFRIAGMDQASESASRVTYPTYVSSHFDAGDRVGIFTLDEGGEAVQNNLPYSVKETGGVQVLDTEGEKAREGSGYRYLIYYPYDDTMTLDGLKCLAHTVSAAQNGEREDDSGLTEYEKSDFLWDLAAVAADESGTPKTDSEGRQFVEVVMDHAMATVIIRIRNGFEGMDPVLRPTFERTVTAGLDLTAAADADALGRLLFPADAASPLAYRSEDRAEIAMQPIELNENDMVQSYSRAYRAAVPPQMLVNGQEIVQIGAQRFRYSGDGMQLEPGKRYTFFIKDPSKPFIDIDEDDSWIFDVVDPLTGEKVGLLCREYIRYQPDHMINRDINFNTKDHITGVPIKYDGTVTTPDEADTKTISSQVWVYYDLWKFAKKKDHSLEDSYQARNQNSLKEDDDPYLDSGIALRFIYDVRYAGDQVMEDETERALAGYKNDEDYTSQYGDPRNLRYWPAPHHNVVRSGGLFLSRHGRPYGRKNNDYGESADATHQREFYMHGGKIYWGCFTWTNGLRFNAVKKFVMPEKKVKTEDAFQYGHINIIRDPKTREIIGTEVSYDPYLTSDMNVGVLIPKYISDARNAEEGVITYPLVKIGYNNIWSKKGLRTRYYNDGTDIKIYQRRDAKFEFPHIFSFPTGTYDANTGSWTSGNAPNDWYSESFDLSQLDIPGSYAYPYNEQYLKVFDYLGIKTENDVVVDIEKPEEEKNFTKLYNFSAIVYKKDLLVPKAGTYDSRMICYIPRTIRYFELTNYIGWQPGTKLMTDHLSPSRDEWQSYTADEVADALKQQFMVTATISYDLVRSYMPNVTGMDFRPISLIRPEGNTQIANGFKGGTPFGANVAFWINADPEYTPLEDNAYLQRDDAVAFIQFNPWDGSCANNSSFESIVQNIFHYAADNGTLENLGVTNQDAARHNVRYRSRLYMGIRPVLKFYHQNGPNPHESGAEQVMSGVKGFARSLKGASSAPVAEAPSRVTGSGRDVKIELAPVVGLHDDGADW